MLVSKSSIGHLLPPTFQAQGISSSQTHSSPAPLVHALPSQTPQTPARHLNSLRLTLSTICRTFHHHLKSILSCFGFLKYSHFFHLFALQIAFGYFSLLLGNLIGIDPHTFPTSFPARNSVANSYHQTHLLVQITWLFFCRYY